MTTIDSWLRMPKERTSYPTNAKNIDAAGADSNQRQRLQAQPFIDEISKQEGSFVIKQKEGFVRIENSIAEANLKLQKVNASDETGDSKMEIDYFNFGQFD